MGLLEWLVRTEFATTINQSPYLLGLLSGFHLLALTLIVGSSIVVCLRCFELLLPLQPLSEVVRPTWNGIVVGFALAAVSGFLMFAPRALSAVEDPAFQVKMTLLMVALVFHFGLYRYLIRSETTATRIRLTGALGLGLWFSVGLAGCAFAVLD